MSTKNADAVCGNCRWNVRGRTCPILRRLWQDRHPKMARIHLQNFGCSLWGATGRKAVGSVLDQLEPSPNENLDTTMTLKLLEKKDG